MHEFAPCGSSSWPRAALQAIIHPALKSKKLPDPSITQFRFGLDAKSVLAVLPCFENSCSKFFRENHRYIWLFGKFKFNKITK